MGLALHDGHAECGEIGAGTSAEQRISPHETHSGAYGARACFSPWHRHSRRDVGICAAASLDVGSIESIAKAASSSSISLVGGKLLGADDSDAASAEATLLGVTRTGFACAFRGDSCFGSTAGCGGASFGNRSATYCSVSSLASGDVPIRSCRYNRSVLGVVCVER